MHKAVFPAILLFFILGVVALSGSGCATIVPPQGGFRDSLPPALIDVRPGDSSTNFRDNRIVFSFDEYVDLDANMQSVIVSPLPKSQPSITRKLNVVTVKLRDSLEENTTYTIDFGEAIKDVNESNVLRDFKYIFSTGEYIDSLQLRGRVLLAETGQIDTNLIVILHDDEEDSALLKAMPRYVAKLDRSGNFVFNNLPAGNYYPYVVGDKMGSYRYARETMFAFSDSAGYAGQSKPIMLYAYKIPADKPTYRTPAAATNTNKPAAADRRLKFQSSLNDGKQNLLDSFSLSFDNPLKQFDSSKARLSTDSTYKLVTGYRWLLDSTRRKLTLINNWQPGVAYHVELDKDFAIDSTNRQLLKPDTIDFSSRSLDEYGRLSIRFRNLDLSKNPVIMLYQDESFKGAYPLTDILLNLPMILPGDYEVRILNDENKNGKWDPGVFFVQRKQPELIKTVQKKITVRPNFINEYEIDVATTTGPKMPTIEPPPQQTQRNSNLRRF